MKAEIITIGDELLIGQTIDTNSAWIGAELSKLGFEICRITSISDKREEILEVLGEVTGRADIVLVTGGLGPTSDDITKQTMCEFFDTKLVVNKEVLSMIEQMLARRNFPMNEYNRRQAEVPESCRVLPNATGTAAGMWFENEGYVLVSMPGVPLEMKHIMSVHVLPELKKRYSTQAIVHKNIMTYGLPEAKLAEILSVFEAELPLFIKLAYLPSLGVIKLRLTAKGPEISELRAAISLQVNKLYTIVPDLIFGEDEIAMEAAVGKLLKDKKATLCTAESCTGGNIAHMITTVPGSSEYYLGSVVAYHNHLKTSLLNVPVNMIEKYGAVSLETAEEMAIGARALFNTGYAVAVTGIAGPGGGTTEKTVGTVCISVASPVRTVSEWFVFGNDRVSNIKRFSLAALNLLRKELIAKE